jgi:predicted GNAT family acetyltransferase
MALPDIRHLPSAGCFETTVDRLPARLDGQEMTIHHTEVSPALEAHGIASAPVRAGVDHARVEGLSILPVCSYALAWIRHHSEHSDLPQR